MEIIKQLFAAFAPAVLTMASFIWAITILLNRTKRLDETDRKTILYIMKLTTILVEKGVLPPQVLIDQIKDLGEFLTALPQDDLIQQVITRQMGVK